MPPPQPWQLREAVRRLRAGGVIAYPTEAVFGLGCDPLNPDAVLQLLELKERPASKGLILIASTWEQLSPYVDLPSGAKGRKILASWPGPVTWTLPARPGVPAWLTGGRDTLAVRITAHEASRRLCDAWGGALVSTSANRSGANPCRTPLCVVRQLGTGIHFLLHAPLGGRTRPTEIRDGHSGRLLRPA